MDVAHRVMVLKCLESHTKDGQLLVDLFVNYDCDLEGANLFERMVTSLVRMAQGAAVWHACNRHITSVWAHQHIRICAPRLPNNHLALFMNISLVSCLHNRPLTLMLAHVHAHTRPHLAVCRRAH